MQKKYRYGNQIEVKQYHTARYGAPGQPRQKKTKPTPEAVRKQNQRRKEEQTARIIGANFVEGDYVRTLTFAPAQRPADMKEAQRIFKDFYQRLRREWERHHQGAVGIRRSLRSADQGHNTEREGSRLLYVQDTGQHG